MITASKAFIAFCLLAVAGTVMVIGPTELRRILPGGSSTEVAAVAKPESKPEVKVIVECDGFQYHSDKERFKTDRQRDRALKALGYDVWRFSGSEIYNDPINAPFELAKYLWDRAEARDVHGDLCGN